MSLHKRHHVSHIVAMLVVKDKPMFIFPCEERHNRSFLALHSCLLCRSGPVALQRRVRASHLIDPKFSDNDVVHRGVNFLPCVVIIALLKDCMNCACDEEKKYETN